VDLFINKDHHKEKRSKYLPFVQCWRVQLAALSTKMDHNGYMNMFLDLSRIRVEIESNALVGWVD